MLDAIKKKFNTAFADKEMSNMKQEKPEMVAELEAAKASLISQAADMQALTELVEEMSAKFNEVKAALEASEAAKTALIAEAKQKRLEVRTAAVEASVGTTKSAALLAATDALDDEAFNSIVNAMATSFDKESKSSLFKEVGASGSADTSEVVRDAEESEEAKLLKKKYQTK